MEQLYLDHSLSELKYWKLINVLMSYLLFTKTRRRSGMDLDSQVPRPHPQVITDPPHSYAQHFRLSASDLQPGFEYGSWLQNMGPRGPEVIWHLGK